MQRLRGLKGGSSHSPARKTSAPSTGGAAGGDRSPRRSWRLVDGASGNSVSGGGGARQQRAPACRKPSASGASSTSGTSARAVPAVGRAAPAPHRDEDGQLSSNGKKLQQRLAALEWNNVVSL
mmetsp:Transcript_98358/g.189957  ORF Transcript_98358/g.189957 Transcript_98358/m.189957 type:complete len:123 (+) Transcript_98358:165-533(+)